MQSSSKAILLTRMATLAAILLAAGCIVLSIGWYLYRLECGYLAAVSAVGVCLASACLAMAVCSRFQGPENIVTVMLIGMALRMGIPLAAAIIARIFGGPLANSFFLNYLIVFYPVTLAAETWLSLPQGRKNDSSAEDFAR